HPQPACGFASSSLGSHIRGKTEAGYGLTGPPILELQLQRELDLPRVRGGRCNDRARGAVLGALEENLIRVREIGVIQNIEHLGPKLQIQSLTDSHPLQQGRVDVEQARTTERTASHVSEGPLQ